MVRSPTESEYSFSSESTTTASTSSTASSTTSSIINYENLLRRFGVDENEYFLDEINGQMIISRYRDEEDEIDQLREENFQMRTMLHRLDILLRNHNRSRTMLQTAMDELQNVRSMVERIEVAMQSVYMQPLIISGRLEGIYENLETFESSHELLMQENHLSTGNHNIEFVYGMNDDLEHLESQPSSSESSDESSMEEVD